MGLAGGVIERIRNRYLAGAGPSEEWLGIPCLSHKSKDNNLAVSVGADSGLFLKCHTHQCVYKAPFRTI